MKELDEFKASGDLIISRTALEVEAILESSTGMSKSETIEIINDIIALVDINILTDDIDRKVAIHKAFNAIKDIISVLPL